MADETENRDGPDRDAASTRSRIEQSARRDALGIGLRRAYQKVLSEPIPDEFSALLDKLSEKDGDRGKG